jgi:hypothetical protein
MISRGAIARLIDFALCGEDSPHPELNDPAAIAKAKLLAGGSGPASHQPSATDAGVNTAVSDSEEEVVVTASVRPAAGSSKGRPRIFASMKSAIEQAVLDAEASRLGGNNSNSGGGPSSAASLSSNVAGTGTGSGPVVAYAKREMGDAYTNPDFEGLYQVLRLLLFAAAPPSGLLWPLSPVCDIVGRSTPIPLAPYDADMLTWRGFIAAVATHLQSAFR